MLTDKELSILKHLRINPRQSLCSISKLTLIPISTVFDRIKSLEKKVIRKYAALTDFSKIGFAIRAFIMLHSDKPQSLISHLKENRSINNAYRITGQYNIFLECLFSSVEQLDFFIDSITEKGLVRAKEVHYVAEDIIREAFIPLRNRE